MIKNKMLGQLSGYQMWFKNDRVYLERRNLQIVLKLVLGINNFEESKLVPCDFRTSLDAYIIDMINVANESRIQRKLREMKQKEILVLEKMSLSDCIKSLEHKTVKVLARQLGSQLTVKEVNVRLGEINESCVEVVLKEALPGIGDQSEVYFDKLRLSMDDEFDAGLIQKQILEREGLLSLKKLFQAFQD